MKSVRLLPIVIFAAVALLLFKGIGLMTSGGYVLTGIEVAAAASSAAPAGEGGGEPTLALETEPTMTDTSPVLDDGAPTLPVASGAAAHGAAPGDEGHGDAAPDAAHGDTPAAKAPAAETPADVPPPDEEAPTVPAIACPPGGRQPTTSEIGAAIRHATNGTVDTSPQPDCPPADPRADAVPMMVDGGGNQVPLATDDGTPLTEKALLERLAARRGDLDAREGELDMREALVQAAEKRIDERTAALQALEARISVLVDQKKAAEDAQFKALIAMYEGMKAAEAAAIFDQLDLDVLSRLARGINPRKMAPIMAKMTATRAQDLTIRLAGDQAPETIDLPATDLAALPQIVGK